MRFFIVVPPGCESICQSELISLNIEQSSMVIRHGGIEIECSMEQGFVLNHVLKSATRVLLRWAEFRVRDFPKLFKKVSELPWGTFYPEDARFEFVASARESRLKIKNRIAETCGKAQEKALASSRLKSQSISQITLPVKSPAKPPGKQAQSQTSGKSKVSKGTAPPFQVFVRLDQDVCTISLDTSGELLHRRGYRVLAPEAPIRENLAAACLLSVASGKDFDPGQQIRVVDPMMGSGTFLVEALSLGQPLMTRNFAYEGFKVFKAAEVKKVLVANSARLLGSGLQIAKVVGWDISQEALGIAQKYLQEISSDLKSAGRKNIYIDIKYQDVFQARGFDDKILASGSKELVADTAVTWVVCNPPYGERIKIDIPFVEYYSELLQAIENSFTPGLCGVILPNKFQVSRLRLPAGWGLGQERLKFENGGIPVRFVVFRRL